MNTTSVSVNKSIPDNSKIEIKAKNGKAEDSFKDMIKNASSKKSSDYKKGASEDKVVGKTKNPANIQGGEDTQKEAGKDITDLGLTMFSQTSIVDPMQLVKIVQVPSEVVFGEPDLAQTQIVGAKTDVKSSAAEVIPETTTNGKAPEKQAIGTTALTYAASQPLNEGVEQERMVPLSQQSGTINTATSNLQEPTDLKQVLRPMEANVQNTSSQGDEKAGTEVAAAEVKPMQEGNVQDAKVMIKVGDTSLNSSWEQVAKEIGEMVVEKVNNEIQKISIKLNPKDLGEINVEFTMDNGKISVALNCTNEGTKSLLAANLDTLSRVVQSSLMQEANVNIHYEKADGQNTGDENLDGRGQGQYQGEENGRRKEQEQADLDFAQKLRLGIENLDDMEG